MNNLIPELIANRLPFGLMPKAMQKKANEIGKESFEQFMGEAWGTIADEVNFYDTVTYRLRPGYKEPETWAKTQSNALKGEVLPDPIMIEDAYRNRITQLEDALRELRGSAWTHGNKTLHRFIDRVLKGEASYRQAGNRKAKKETERDNGLKFACPPSIKEACVEIKLLKSELKGWQSDWNILKNELSYAKKETEQLRSELLEARKEANDLRTELIAAKQ